MCSASWEWIKLERIRGPAGVRATTAAALSSQLVSIPRTTIARDRSSERGLRAPSSSSPGSAGRRYLVGFEGFVGGGIDFQQLDGITPQRGGMPDYGATALFFEQHAIMHVMRKNEAAIASEIDIDDLNVRLAAGQIILPGESAANLSIADIVMDRFDAQRRLCAVVRDMEQPEPADHRRAEMLQDEAFVAVI